MNYILTRSVNEINPAPLLPGTSIMACTLCKCDVYVSPSSVQVMDSDPGEYGLVCNSCYETKVNVGPEKPKFVSVSSQLTELEQANSGIDKTEVSFYIYLANLFTGVPMDEDYDDIVKVPPQ